MRFLLLCIWISPSIHASSNISSLDRQRLALAVVCAKVAIYIGGGTAIFCYFLSRINTDAKLHSSCIQKAYNFSQDINNHPYLYKIQNLNAKKNCLDLYNEYELLTQYNIAIIRSCKTLTDADTKRLQTLIVILQCINAARYNANQIWYDMYDYLGLYQYIEYNKDDVWELLTLIQSIEHILYYKHTEKMKQLIIDTVIYRIIYDGHNPAETLKYIMKGFLLREISKQHTLTDEGYDLTINLPLLGPVMPAEHGDNAD